MMASIKRERRPPEAAPGLLWRGRDAFSVLQIGVRHARSMVTSPALFTRVAELTLSLDT